MTRNVPLVCVWMLVTGLAAGNAQAGVFEDHFDGPPADDDPEKHGYTITHNYEGPGTKFRTWFYDSAGQPDVMYSSQNGNGFTYSACLESSEVLTSNIWGVTGILVSATKVYDPGDVMEYHFGLIVSTNTALSDSWLILRWMNYGSTPGWGIRYKVSGTVSSSLLASQAPAFSGGETVTIEGNADGTFNLLVDGIGDSNFTIAGLDSRDMKKFGFYGHSANSGTSYAFEYDDLVATVVDPPARPTMAIVFEDHFDSAPADDDPEAHEYTITHNYEGPGTKFRTWFYDSAGQPDVMYSSQNGDGFTYSACLQSNEVLSSSGWWGVTGILVSATKVYDPGDVMEYHFGLIVSTNTALSDSWLILRWMNYGSTPGWGIRYKVSGTVSSSVLARQAEVFSGGETVSIQGNADGTFNFLVDGTRNASVTIAGLDSRDMKNFGFYGHSANSGTSYAFEYDDLVVTAPAPAQGTIVILR